MAALPEDIAAITRPAAIVIWSDAVVKLRYPNSRDGSLDPAEGFYDAIADAQEAIDQRAELIGTDRRRFATMIDEVIWLDPLTGPVSVTLIDSEQRANGPYLVARYEVDLDAETTTLELFG